MLISRRETISISGFGFPKKCIWEPEKHPISYIEERYNANPIFSRVRVQNIGHIGEQNRYERSRRIMSFYTSFFISQTCYHAYPINHDDVSSRQENDYR